MSRKFTTSAADEGMTLARFLVERLPLEADRAGEIVRAGSVYIGRRRALDPERALTAGERVIVYAVEAPPRPPQLTVVYEDRDVIVIEKPPGMPSQAERRGAMAAADRLVRARDPHARLFHRLDREASGLLLFTRRSEARRRMQRYLEEGRLERRYRAVVWGHLVDDRGTFDRPIGPDPRDRRRQAAGAGKAARTDFQVLRRGRSAGGRPCTLVELLLRTGRTHQVRLHLADAGHPICGDPLYVSRVEPEEVGRLALAAVELAWPGRRVESPAPLNTPVLAGVLT